MNILPRIFWRRRHFLGMQTPSVYPGGIMTQKNNVKADRQKVTAENYNIIDNPLFSTCLRQ